MQIIRYEPVHGSLEPIQGAGVELTPGVDTPVTDEQAEALLRNCYIVDAASGKNPNFVCVECGANTFEEGVFDAVRARTHESPIRPLVVDGERRCATCLPGASSVPNVIPPVVVRSAESASHSYSDHENDD